MEMILKNGYSICEDEMENAGCNNGNYPSYRVYFNGKVVQSGLTCRCGRGCSNTDCIVDYFGHHDTDIEEFRDYEAEGYVAESEEDEEIDDSMFEVEAEDEGGVFGDWGLDDEGDF